MSATDHFHNMDMSASQLAALIDCAPISYKCMKRWLDRNGWPYAIGRNGHPKVGTAYHEARLTGIASQATKATLAEQEPNLETFR